MGQLDDLDEAERIASKSRLTEKDVEERAGVVDEGLSKRWKAMAREARS